MKLQKLIFASIMFMMCTYYCCAQENVAFNDNPSYHSMLINGNTIFALDQEGHLNGWSLQNHEKLTLSIDTALKLISFAKDTAGQIYLGSLDGKIYKFTADYSAELYMELKKSLPVSELFFNSKNKLTVIFPNGVYNPATGKIKKNFEQASNGMWVKKRFLYFFWKKTNKYFNTPQYVFLDSKDRIWMTSSFGEFGGSLQLYDTRTNGIINFKLNGFNYGLFNPKSIFEDDKENIYITSGLEHMMHASGEVIKISGNNYSVIYRTDNAADSTKTYEFGGGTFIGPGTYNKLDRNIYLATDAALYRAVLPDSASIGPLEFLFDYSLNLRAENLAIGSTMPVIKLDFTEDKKLVFLTTDSGIGIYDGKKLIMLK